MHLTLRPFAALATIAAAAIALSPSSFAAPSIDESATGLTQVLYQNLLAYTTLDAAVFGQQFATWKGLNADGTTWQGNANRSDIKTVTGTHPGISGWNFDTYLYASNTQRTAMRQRMLDDFARGMILTIHWEMRNPLTGDDAKDRTGAGDSPSVLVLAVTTGEAANTKLNSDLDALATLLGQLNVNAEPVPVIFRPYHEMNGDWFWWGGGVPSEFTALWNYTLTYLRDTKGVHQLLYCYAPSGNQFNSKAEYLTYWPGNAKADICGVDQYLKDTDPISKWNDSLGYAYQAASGRGKPAAFTEIGRSGGLAGTTNPAWWTSRVLAAFNDSSRPLWTKCAYLMTWTNQTASSYWVPYYTGHAQAADFQSFASDAHVLLQGDFTPYQ